MDLAKALAPPFLSPPGRSSESLILVLREAVLPPAPPSRVCLALIRPTAQYQSGKESRGSLHPFRFLVPGGPGLFWHLPWEP